MCGILTAAEAPWYSSRIVFLMTPGPNASPFFLGKLVPRAKEPLLSVCRNLLSMGSIGYYLNNDDQWQTRVYIYNHFALLNDAPFSTRWEAIFYNRRGQEVAKRSGVFERPETVILETANIPELDRFGVISVHIKDNDGRVMLHELYSSVFFTEFYVPGTKKTIIAHCLSGAPKASHCGMDHVSTSWVTPAGFRPYLYIANSCRFQGLFHRACGRAAITFLNYAGKKKTIQLEPLPQLGCHKIDLFSQFPGLADHLGTDPYAMRLVGKNILHKPFMIQTNGTIVLGEHL